MLVAIAVGVAGVLFAAYLRFVEPFRPGVTTPLGFYEFADQGHYLTTANVLAHWHFPTRPSEYWYGLGYPILGVPFIWLRFEGDPFAPVDALAFGATLAFTFVLGTRVSPFRSFTSALAIGLGAAFTVGLASPLTGLTSVPWNTNIVVPLAAFVFVVATSTGELSWLRAVALGLAIGWIFATRYTDALFIGLVVLAMLGRLRAA